MYMYVHKCARIYTDVNACTHIHTQHNTSCVSEIMCSLHTSEVQTCEHIESCPLRPHTQTQPNISCVCVHTSDVHACKHKVTRAQRHTYTQRQHNISCVCVQTSEVHTCLIIATRHSVTQSHMHTKTTQYFACTHSLRSCVSIVYYYL